MKDAMDWITAVTLAVEKEEAQRPAKPVQRPVVEGRQAPTVQPGRKKTAKPQKSTPAKENSVSPEPPATNADIFDPFAEEPTSAPTIQEVFDPFAEEPPGEVFDPFATDLQVEDTASTPEVKAVEEEVFDPFAVEPELVVGNEEPVVISKEKEASIAQVQTDLDEAPISQAEKKLDTEPNPSLAPKLVTEELTDVDAPNRAYTPRRSAGVLKEEQVVAVDQVEVTLSEETQKQLRTLATATGMSPSLVVEQAVKVLTVAYKLDS